MARKATEAKIAEAVALEREALQADERVESIKLHFSKHQVRNQGPRRCA